MTISTGNFWLILINDFSKNKDPLDGLKTMSRITPGPGTYNRARGDDFDQAYKVNGKLGQESRFTTENPLYK